MRKEIEKIHNDEFGYTEDKATEKLLDLFSVSHSLKLKEKALHWWMVLSDNGLWDKMEKKHGYYGHDIGTTEEDIIDMYKAEYNCG